MSHFSMPLRIDEASPYLANLFDRWVVEGKPVDLTYALESALWRYRRTWFIAGDYLFKLSVSSRGEDYIRVLNRSESLVTSDLVKE